MSSLPGEHSAELARTLARLDAWFQTMRGPGGYGGPISHWWDSSLLYCGPMADWRYEGILCGYVSLYRSTRELRWLDRARQAGDDLRAAQLASGKYRNSSFEQGPIEGGTPHECGVDVGLLELARLLHEMDDESWRNYFQAAERNLQQYVLGDLWHGNGFLDMPFNETLVPNKNATAIEALVLYEALSAQDMGRYLEAAAQVILDAQERDGRRAGGIVHTGTGRHRLAVSVYTARSVCGLLRLHERHPQDKWLEAASHALHFLSGLITPEGVYWGRYPDGGPIANPRLVAAAGDLLRATAWGCKYGISSEDDVEALTHLLVRTQSPSGGIPTAYGFACRGGRRAYRGLPEFRDVLPVVGWCDKAFRALTGVAPANDMEICDTEPAVASTRCNWKGRPCVFLEDESQMALLNAKTGEALYHWLKGHTYPEEYHL